MSLSGVAERRRDEESRRGGDWREGRGSKASSAPPAQSKTYSRTPHRSVPLTSQYAGGTVGLRCHSSFGGEPGNWLGGGRGARASGTRTAAHDSTPDSNVGGARDVESQTRSPLRRVTITVGLHDAWQPCCGRHPALPFGGGTACWLRRQQCLALRAGPCRASFTHGGYHPARHRASRWSMDHPSTPYHPARRGRSGRAVRTARVFTAGGSMTGPALT